MRIKNQGEIEMILTKAVIGYAGIIEHSWIEELKVPGVDIKKEWNDITNNFNLSLRKNEKARTIIMVRTKYTNMKYTHDWEKSNLVTISKNGQMYDTYKCCQCGITGKRFGLNSGIQRDKKYKSTKYENCKGPK